MTESERLTRTERILSGPGKVHVHHFLKDTGRGEEPAWLAELLAHGDPTPVISEMALNGRSELCVTAPKPFTSIYGAASYGWSQAAIA